MDEVLRNNLFQAYEFLFCISSCAYFQGPVGSGATHTFTCSSPKLGRYVFVALRVKEYLTLCEVKVYALKHGLSL